MPLGKPVVPIGDVAVRRDSIADVGKRLHERLVGSKRLQRVLEGLPRIHKVLTDTRRQLLNGRPYHHGEVLLPHFPVMGLFEVSEQEHLKFVVCGDHGGQSNDQNLWMALGEVT